MKNRSLYFWAIWFTVTAVCFVLFYFEVGYLLNNPVTIQNMIAYLVLSLTFGAVTSTLYLLNLRIMLWIFLAGLGTGFFEMALTFLNSASGWEDLVGLITLFTWMTIGLCAGAAVQFLRFLLKIRSRRKESSAKQKNF
ncbi:MAG: hypothetical protein GX485_08420 [Clostridiales bacterium]|jgi:hypothetical protein|nr:hypothetical protein [Clostridiales bacterium]